jgi:GNAT superfamily N-acetyltransferase
MAAGLTRGRAGPPPVYRLARPEDLAACTRVWRAGLADYLGRLNADDGLPYDLGPLHRLLAHLLATDPERFWVAVHPDLRDGRTAAGRSAAADRSEDGTGRADPTAAAGTVARPGDSAARGDRLVGFGSAVVRGDTWFLAMLFVDPLEQASGIGSELLRRTMTDVEGRALGTATDTAQPIGSALYARQGIVPRMPCLHLVGRPEPPDALPPLPPDLLVAPFDRVAGEAGATGAEADMLDRAVAAIDRDLLGYERPTDHAWMQQDGRSGWLYRARDGRPVGYGYTTAVGRIGPVAVLERDLLLPVVAHLLQAVRPPGASSLWVPGAAGEVIAGLLRARFRLEPFPALVHWTRPLADFERYLPISLALV